MNEVKPWYESKILWAQIVALLFGVGAKLEWWPVGISQEEVLSVVMAIIAAITIALRLKSRAVIAPASSVRRG